MKPTLAASLTSLAVWATAQTWTNPNGGNVNAQIGDSSILYGSQPPWYVLDAIKDNCSPNACMSVNTFTVDTTVVVDTSELDGTITLAVDGTFNDPGQPGSLEDIVEIVKTLSAHSYNVTKDVPYIISNGCIASKWIPCPPNESETMDLYNATSLFTVRVEDDDGDFLADLSVQLSIEIDDPLAGVCETIMSVGGVVAGEINHWAGDAFTLASLACGDDDDSD